MNLGQFIKHLELGDPNSQIQFDFPEALPTTFASYRGDYDQLALGHGVFQYTSDFVRPTVGSLLEKARAALGETFTGWKGGNYTMFEDTRLWVANRGSSSGVEIVGVDHFYVSIIHTRYVDN